MKKKVLQRRYGGYLFDPLSENLIPHKNLGLKWKKRLQKRWGGRLLSSSLGRGLKNLYEKQKLFLPLQSSCSEGGTSTTPKGLEGTLTLQGVKETGVVGDAGNSNSLKGQRYWQSVWELPSNPSSPNGVRTLKGYPSKEERSRSNSFPIKRLLEHNLNHPLTNWGQLSSEDVPMSGADSSSSTRGEEFFVGGGVYGRVGGKKEFFSSTGGRVKPFKPVLSAPLHLYGVHQFLFFQKKSSSDNLANPYRLLRTPNPLLALTPVTPVLALTPVTPFGVIGVRASKGVIGVRASTGGTRGNPNLKLPLVTPLFEGTEVPPKGANPISSNPLGGSSSPFFLKGVRTLKGYPVKGRGQKGEVTPFTPLKVGGTGEGGGVPRKGSEKVYLSSSLQIKGELTRLEGFKRSSLFKSQLSERKKLSIFYGNLSRRKLFEIFNRGKLFKGSHFENSLSLLERRADVALFRIGFFPTILSARQWIRHGRVVLNGQTLRVGSFLLSPGDFLSIPSRYHRFFLNSSTSEATPKGNGVRTGDSKERSFFPLPPFSFDPKRLGETPLSFLLPSFKLGAPHRLLLNELIRGFPFHLKKTGGESVNTRAQKDLHLHKGREDFTQRPSSNPFRGCENTLFAPLKLYRKLTLERGFPATQNLAPHIQNLFRGSPSLGVRGTGVTPSFDPVSSSPNGVTTPFSLRGCFARKGVIGLGENGGKEGVTGLGIRSGRVSSTKNGTGAENFSSPKKYLGGGRWSYSSRPPFAPTLEFTPKGVHPSPPSERLTPLRITRVPPTVLKKREGEEKETPRKGFPQPFFKKNSFRGGKSLSVRPIKPTHLEVSYTHLTAIYLYSPQKISFPALLDLETIERSFRCGI
jgi:ribosomal protein S4